MGILLLCSGRGRNAVESLASEGLTAMFHQLDINDGKSITTAAAYFKEKYGGVDVLVNNAGIAFKGIFFVVTFLVMCKICWDKSFLCSQLQTQPRFLSRQKKP